jgi:hypothetical protein
MTLNSKRDAALALLAKTGIWPSNGTPQIILLARVLKQRERAPGRP